MSGGSADARGLATRDATLREHMDDPDCDPAMLARTYRDFRVVNRLVSGWAGVYRRGIRPLLSAGRPTSLLDIGSGGGDLPRAIAAWARRDGVRLEITAIDPDPRAHDFARTVPGAGVRYRRAASDELVGEGARFDIVTSNHLLHHLDEAGLVGLLRDSRALARSLVIHSDIERARLGYACYALATRPFARHSFIHADGLRSIRRSYRAGELRAAAGPGWRVERRFPQRLLLVARPGATPQERS